MRPRKSCALRRTTSALVVFALAAMPAIAGDGTGLWHSLAAPVRALQARKPATCRDDAVERLAAEIDWLAKHIRDHGSIVPQQPSVWGQNRLTRYRQEYEEQLRSQLPRFQELNHASLRRSDQSFLGLAMALDAAATAPRGAAPRRVQAPTVTNMISNPAGGGAPSEAVILRTPPFVATPEPFASFGLDGDDAISLEPTIHLDHLSRYLSHLHELRRINEGDDVADAPGYALTLVRVPVSIIPGERTQTGHGAEITITAVPRLGDDLLPTTFQNLVVNDLVDLLAPRLAFAVNTPEVRGIIRTVDSAAPPAGMRALGSMSVSVPSPKQRRARMPLPPEHLVEALGARQIVLLLRGMHDALATDPAAAPCIEYAAVRGYLAEELHAAVEFLAQPRQAHVWEQLPGWNLAELVRSRRAAALELRRREFFEALGADVAIGFPEPPAMESPPRSLLAPADDACLGASANPLSDRCLCRTPTAVLAWAILVESALLDARLTEDMHRIAVARGFADDCIPAGPFFGPRPAAEARAAFNEYVRRRWPIRVFAIDPVTQEQNVEEQDSRRREVQLAMALAYSSGRIGAESLTRYARRLESDLSTVSLNKTVVGFTHGADTFGWRFYPRVQPPPTRGTLATVADTLCGTPSHARELAGRRLEPGTRECTAVVVMPSFVPFVTFDVQTSWFSLAHPHAAQPSMRRALVLSRSVKALQQSASACFPGQGCYRAGDVAHLMRSIDHIDRSLPLQTMVAQIPYENTAGGFELFNAGVSDLAPELIGWYGAPGVDPAGGTVLFLLGKGFSVLDTNVIAGGRPVRIELLGRQLLRAEIPPGVQTLRPAVEGQCPESETASSAPSVRQPTLRLPLPAPGVELVAPPAAVEADGANPCGCGGWCHGREFVTVHLATPYGVSDPLLIPVLGSTTGAVRGGLAFAEGHTLRLSASRTRSESWRVNEYFEPADAPIRITVPPVFAPPPKAILTFMIHDDATGTAAGTFSIDAPPFDARAQEYVLAGSHLRNFVGDTSRPATDRTLRGALKPYLDSLGTGASPEGRPGIERRLRITANLVTETKTIPIDGAIAVEIRRRDQAADTADDEPAAPR